MFRNNMLSAKGDGMTHFDRSLEGAPGKRNGGRPPLPRLTPIEAAQRLFEPM
ncbi:hypothetical protein OVA07_16345 [Novosphingobium sp. SL115]|uniref:hypothetical protein n=1 Tax=Novosphingobium sp. SL115 TaxID=2995150 RepID=UPI0022752CB8|nr:hypothetical protein [Novosphingobium sp. SL115]MCY1672573.1 hypothetical protein [Novosphingobium sp. SL115]